MVKLGGLASEEAFFKKLSVTVEKNESVKALGAAARQAVDGYGGDDDKARKWAEEEYMPHLSLL